MRDLRAATNANALVIRSRWLLRGEVIIAITCVVLVGIKEDGVVSHAVPNGRVLSIISVELKLKVASSIIVQFDVFDDARIETGTGAAVPPVIRNVHSEPLEGCRPLGIHGGGGSVLWRRHYWRRVGMVGG